jgi:hypothetical protein
LLQPGRSQLRYDRSYRDQPRRGLEGPTILRVDALEAIDGTPIIDLKIAMREAPDA